MLNGFMFLTALFTEETFVEQQLHGRHSAGKWEQMGGGNAKGRETEYGSGAHGVYGLVEEIKCK